MLTRVAIYIYIYVCVCACIYSYEIATRQIISVCYNVTNIATTDVQWIAIENKSRGTTL